MNTLGQTATQNYPAITLTSGDGRASLEILPEHGGIINQLEFEFPDGERRNVIAGLNTLEEIENNNYYRGVALYPFVNRLRDGAYEHMGERYQFPINEQTLHNALHGFLFTLPASATVVEQSDNKATLRLDYVYDGTRAEYPFPAKIWMIYRLDSSGELSLEMGVENGHCESVPVGCGWHPYFQLGESVDDLLLKMPESKQVLVDNRLLPSGEEVPFTEFQELKLIGSKNFDTCFNLMSNSTNNSVSKVIICSQSSHVGLEIWQETGAGRFNFLQVCIPPDRQSIAVEPVSCGIDAFNTKHGLTYLPPGETWSARCGVRIRQ